MIFLKLNTSSFFSKNVLFFALICFLFLTSCATKHIQFGKKIATITAEKTDANKIQTLYFIGNTADINLKHKETNLNVLNSVLSKADSSSYLVFLGDNFNPKLRKYKSKFNENQLTEDILNVHLNIADNFKGKTLFIPGNLDWELGIENLKFQEDYLTHKLSSPSYFLPKDGCGLGSIEVGDKIGIIAVDSQWFLEDWDDHPEINENCNIKTREDFYFEFESLLNQFQNRTTLVVLHHPLVTNSVHGGKFSLIDHLFPFEAKVPLPAIGTLLNLIRSTGGLSDQDIQNALYRDFASRLATLIQERDNIIVVAGHDKNLQYIENGNLKQVISGSISDSKPAKISGPFDFSYGGDGFVTVDIFDDGAAIANFFEVKDNGVEKIFSRKIVNERNEFENLLGSDSFEKNVASTVYNPDTTKKTNFYNFLFGRHFRDIYGKEVILESANLSDLYGGLTPVRMDKGNRSNQLILKDKYSKNYNLEPVRKSATSYIQAIGFKHDYVAKEFKNTFTEKFLLDFYTSSHPYYPLVVPNMQDALGIYNSDIGLYYVPKQFDLKEYNEFFGDEIYMINEVPTVSTEVSTELGKPNKVVTTEEMLNNIQQSKDVSVDKETYMRIRLFDMLIGDSHRNADQWNWAEFNEKGKTVYVPLPKKRDQIFPNYDGLLFKLALGNPYLRHLQDYDGDTPNLKWLNRRAYTLDLAILEASDLEAWNKQVDFIQKNLTQEIVRNSFEILPKESRTERDDEVIESLLKRKDNLHEFASDYHKVLANIVILKGTNQSDSIIVTRKPKGITNVKMYSGINQELFLDRDFNRKETREIRIYGLNNQDYFKVEGKGNKRISVRLIGGSDNDNYDIRTSKKIKVYDYKNDNSTDNIGFFTSRRFSNDYEMNTYDYKSLKYDLFNLQPNFGYNPDDGLKVGLAEIITLYGFESKPFSQKHIIKADYFFATKGFDFNYQGSFMKALGKWNIDVNARFTSPTFSINFFGLGNNSVNEDDVYGMNYNRVRQRSYELGPSFYRIFRNKARLDIYSKFQYVEIENTRNRIVHFSKDINPDVFDGQHFTEVGANYTIKNYDNESLPTLGMIFLANAKWVVNNNTAQDNFVKLKLNLGFTHKITSEGRLTFASMLKSDIIFGDGYEFYQAASIGGDDDLRGYRQGRFAGQSSFTQSSDLRYDILKLKIGVPMRLGVFGGFDYGRVWLSNEDSDRWHTSYGGGIWLNGAQMVTARVSYFQGQDNEGRVVFGLNFGF